MADAQAAQSTSATPSPTNYALLLPYDPKIAGPNGGDSLRGNLNVFYQSGDIAWVLTSTVLIALMIPGAG
jgi:ammonium transporter, Amt family